MTSETTDPAATELAAGGSAVWVVFDSDDTNPPGQVIATFSTQAEAQSHTRGPGDGYGWSIFPVTVPTSMHLDESALLRALQENDELRAALGEIRGDISKAARILAQHDCEATS